MDKNEKNERYLIGPAFFDLYWLVLRIVLAAAGGGVLLALLIETAANPPTNSWETVARIFGSVINAIFMAFGAVTIIFALNERFNPQAREAVAKINIPGHLSKPKQLASSGLLIKKADPIVAIVFMVIALIVINVSIDLIGFYVVTDQQTTITPLFSDLFARFLPWLNLSIVLNIILEGFKLVTGRWTLPLVIGSIVQRTIGLIITLQMFADTKIFNVAFFDEVDRVFNATQTQMPLDLPARIAQAIIIIAIFGYCIDLLTIVWKGIRILSGGTDKRPNNDQKEVK